MADWREAVIDKSIYHAYFFNVWIEVAVMNFFFKFLT